MIDYKDFKYWLVETKASGAKIWRIQLPGGHKIPPREYESENAVKAEIDQLIAQVQERKSE